MRTFSDYLSESVRQKEPPKHSVVAYKLFRMKDGKLYPLYVKAKTEVPIGVWLDADEGDKNPKTGKVKSSLGDLAYRPGWHASDFPASRHIGGSADWVEKKDKKAGELDYRRDNEVWAEVLISADVDWQPIANENGRNKNGKIIPAKAQIKSVPTDGFYKYKTNPNMLGTWYIGGSMKVIRVLDDEEVKKINLDKSAKLGMVIEDLPRYKDLIQSQVDKFTKEFEESRKEIYSKFQASRKKFSGQ